MKNFLRGKIQTANANYQGLYYPLNYDEAKLTSKTLPSEREAL